jgi:four helix bundle protein
MAKGDELRDRIYRFALRLIQFVRMLPREMAAYELGRQLLKAGTSVAANFEEARGGYSKEDFTYKMSLAFKEAKESNLWLRLIRDSGLSKGKEVEYLVKESQEIRNILGKSVSTAGKRDKD